MRSTRWGAAVPLLVFGTALIGAGLTIALLLHSASGPEIQFADVAAERGVRASMQCGTLEKRLIPEANGSGAAWLDYDNDGWMDLLIVNGAGLDVLESVRAGKVPPPRKNGVYLFHNLGNGHFEDVTEKAGLTNPYWGTGVAVADFNNDGYPDILILNIGLDLLYKNNGNGTFTEVGAAAGLSRTFAWHTGGAFGDYDNDGNLDLYVAGYVGLHAFETSPQPPICDYRGVMGFCGPMGQKGEPDILYHYNGNGTFSDVTKAAGVTDAGLYKGFSVVFHDFNGDGKVDIFVANDGDPNYLYINQGKGTFKESAMEAGLALNEQGNAHSNMGVAIGDYNNDGLIDVLTTTFSDDYFPLFQQTKPGLYEDVSYRVGLGTETLPYVGWACGLTDLTNDGWRDLWSVNGHVYPGADKLSTSKYFQRFLVFKNHAGKFASVDDAFPKQAPNSYRGGCAADFNNNGRMGIIMLPISGAPVLLENRSQNTGNWLGLRLRGTRSNRDAIGAFVRVEHCGKVQVDAVRNGGSYISQEDPRMHFGLGACGEVQKVTIRWPSGTVQVLTDLAANQYVVVQEPR
jgi:hypothetical protein